MINIYDLTGSEQFKTLPYERKQYVLNRYFTDFVSSDKRFLSLSDGEQKKAYSTFMKTHLGEPPMTPKEQAAYAQMVEADTITPEKAEQYNKQIELGRQSSDVIDIAPKLSLPKDYTPADTSKMDKESKKQYYRAAESLQIAKQLGNKESAEHWEGMLRHYKNKDEYDRTGVIISTAGQEAVRKQNLEFMASATRSDFPLEPTYPQQQLTKIKEKEAVEERKEQFYEKREQEYREKAISYQDNNRRLMRLALIKSSWTPEQNAEYGKLLKEQGEIEEYFKSGGLTPRQRDAIMMGSKAAKERNLASSMADAFFSGTLQFVTSPYTVFIPSSGISDYMYYYDMGYGSEVGAIESLFRGTVSSLPMNLMMMVNPAVGVALTMSSITSGGIKEDYEAGMLDAQTIMTNILSGAVQTAIEYMSAEAQKAIYTKTFRTGGMKALQDAVHEDVKNVFFPTFKSFASAFGASAVEEGMEEIYQNVADRIIRATVNDEEMPDLKEWVPELAYEFAGGFLGAALTGTAFSAIQISQSKKMQQNITKYANQGYEYAQLTQNAIDAVNAGNYDQAFNLISQAQDAAREIGNPNKQVLQGIGAVQSAIMMYDKNKIVVTEAIIDAHEIRAKELRQELAELKKARYVNEDAALSRDARVLEIQEELVEIRDNILARQQSLVANEHVAVMKKSMDKMIEHIEANPELAEKYALQAAQAQESALLSTREISERDKAGLQAGISTEDDYRTAVDRHFTEGLADEVIEMEMKPGDFAPSRIEPYVYTDINIDESVTPKKTKEKKTDVKSEAKEDKEMAKPEPLAEDTLKTIKAEADKAIASKDKANLQKAKKTLDEALKKHKDQRLVDIRRSLNSEIADIVEQERAVKEKEKAKKAKKAKEEADKQQREDMTKRRKDELITKGIEAAAEKYGINIKQYETRSEIADAIIERQDAVRKSLAEHSRAMGTDYEKIKEAARELGVPIKGKKEVLKQEVLKAREAQIIKEISTKETLHHERGLLKEYNESMKPKVDETVQKIDGIVQEVKDTRIDLSRETDEAKRGEHEAEINKNVKEIDSAIAELQSIQKEAGDNHIAVEKIQAEINKLEKVARPLSEADVTQRTDVNLNKANELIDTRSIEETGVIPEAQIGDTATVSKENDNFEITYILVPIDEVVTSHNIDTLNQNENYPAELQNRVRENHAEDVHKIAAKLNPRILMHNDIASDGRPIGFIGKDGKVYIIAGNGRTIALKMRADGQYGNLNQYEQVLKSNLKELGFQDQDVAGKMLVGIYNGREDLVKLAISLNRGETQALSETEAARTDARTLIKLDESGDGIIRLLSEKGDILSESNNKFVNAFIDEVVPESERSKYRTKGTISVKVEERIKNALFMYVFDDSSKAASLLSSLKDVGDSNVKSMLHGIMENVKEMALLKYLDASYDFSSDLIDAVHETESLRAKGENLDIAQNQMDVFANDEVKSHLLTAVYRIKSPKEAAGFVKAYTEISLNYADGGQDTLDFAKLTKEQIRAEFLKRWLFGEIKDMKSAKEAYIKARELTVHKPLAELEFKLYEAMAEQLAPRMGLTVDQFFAEYFDVFTTEAPIETNVEGEDKSIRRLQKTTQETIKGYIQKLSNGKYRVGFMDANATTGLHEQGHFGKDMLYVMAEIDQSWARYVEIAEEFSGVGEDGVWTAEAEEKFADGYLKYVTEGEAPTSKLKAVFEKIKDLISKVVSKLADIMDIELTNDIREVYGALLGAEITTKEDARKAKVDAFITKVDAADFASKDVDVLTKRLGSEFGSRSRFIIDRKLSRGKTLMNINDIDTNSTVVNITQVEDGYIVNGEHAYNNGEAMDIVNKLIDDYAPGDIDMGKKDSTRFQMPSYAREIMEVRKKYEGTDQWMKAPNGKPTNLTERQWLHTQTESFKEWFGNSKIVDENGDPRVVYHGVSQEGRIDFFDRAKLGEHTRARSAEKGFFFAKDIDTSSIYGVNIAEEAVSLVSSVGQGIRSLIDIAAEMNVSDGEFYKDIIDNHGLIIEEQNALMDTYLVDTLYDFVSEMLENVREEAAYIEESEGRTIDISEAEIDAERVMKYIESVKNSDIKNIERLFLSIENPAIHDYKGEKYRDKSYDKVLSDALKAGKDGAILRNTYDGAGMTDIYVAFTDTQMKSATENIGAYGRDTNLIRYQKSDAYEKKQKSIQEQNETNAKIIREELDTAPSAEKAKEAVVNAIKRALMINYEGAEAMDVIKRRQIENAIKEQQKLGNTETVKQLEAEVEMMKKRDQRFRDILREETGFRSVNNITLEQALKMLDRVDPVLYDRFVNESTRKVLVNSINLLESMGKKGFVYDKNTLDLFFDYFTSEHVDTVKRSGLSTLFLMPQRYLVETFGKAGQKLVELAYIGTLKRSDYEHQYHPSLQRIYDLQMTNKNGRGRAYRGEEIDAIGRTILEVDGNSKIEPKNKLNAIQNILGEWAEKNDTIINMNDIEEMYRAKQEIIAMFKGFIVEFNNSEIAKLHGIQIGLIEEYGNPRIYEQEGSAKPAKDKILHVPANVKERTEVDYNAEAKHNTNLYEVYLSYATSMAKYMAFYELAAYMEGNEELIPGSGEGENVTIVPAQFYRDISSIQRVAAKGALKENGYVDKYIKNVIGTNETPTSATRMFGALKTITFASTLVPSIPMTILNFHQRTLIDTQVGAEIAWQVRKDIKFFSGRGRFDSEAFPTLSRIMDMYRGADTSLIAETASAAQKSATEGGRSWFAKMYYKGAEFSAKMLEASPFSKAELGNRAYAHLAGIYQIVTQTAEYKQARKDGMNFRQAVEHVLTNHDNIRQDAIHNGGVVNAEINADVNPAFAPRIFWKDTGLHKYLMFVRYGITLAQLEMRKFAAPFLSMKSRQSQQIYDMLRSGNIQAADHAQYIQAAQIMLKMTDERARSKMLAEGKIDSKKMSDKRLSIQEVESFHNMLQQILDESIDVAKEKHSDVIKGTKTETLEAAQMMNFTIRELMLRTILAFVISMLPTWRKDKKEIDIIAMLSELNTYIGLFQTPQMITDFRLGGAMVPRMEYYYKDKQIIKGLTDWALRVTPGLGILNNFIKGITGRSIAEDTIDTIAPSKAEKQRQKKKRRK